jgi:hypothetical protein
VLQHLLIQLPTTISMEAPGHLPVQRNGLPLPPWKRALVVSCYEEHSHIAQAKGESVCSYMLSLLTGVAKGTAAKIIREEKLAAHQAAPQSPNEPSSAPRRGPLSPRRRLRGPPSPHRRLRGPPSPRQPLRGSRTPRQSLRGSRTPRQSLRGSRSPRQSLRGRRSLCRHFRRRLKGPPSPG